MLHIVATNCSNLGSRTHRICTGALIRSLCGLSSLIEKEKNGVAKGT